MAKKNKGLDLLTVDNLAHMAGGAVIGLAMWRMGGYPSYVAFLFALGLGFGREFLQHLDNFPRLSLHQIGEAISWGAGAGLVAFVRLWL